ncbi:MAG: hypothetical protein U0637_07060 [Phycisphaerales bacterium]
MKKVIGLLAIVAAAGAANASTSSTTFSVFGTATFTNVNSMDVQGDIDNVLGSWVSTGSGTVTAIRVTGSLTEVNTGTYASEARVRFSAGAGSAFSAFNFQASTVGNYTGTLAIGPTQIAVTPFTLTSGGTVNLEWFDSYDDAANSADSTWNTVTYEFGAGTTTVTNGSFALGALNPNGVQVVTNSAHVAGGLDFFTFNLPYAVTSASDYLNIAMQPIAGGTGNMTDTEFALYDAAGNLVATSDDEGPGLFSELSYGAGDPLAAPDLAPGFNGLALAAGGYTVVTGGYNTAFPATLSGTFTPGTNAGNYQLAIQYVPTPGALALLGMGGLVASRRRRA